MGSYMGLQIATETNNLEHWSQGKGFLAVWVLLCFFKLSLSENDLGHWSQRKGFSPEWIFLWIIKLLTKLNDLGHWSQEKVVCQYGFFCVSSTEHFDKMN